MKNRAAPHARDCQSLHTCIIVLAVVLGYVCRESQGEEREVPVITDGETQIVPEFRDPDSWIRHDLWVETEFDSDGDGKLDRMHVDVTRPRQTESEGLRLPVIYISSPYFGGTGSKGQEYFWDTRHELGATPPLRKRVPPIERKGTRPIISRSHVKEWVPHGYVVVHSSSPGTGLSQGCPTIGRDNESLAPAAVIDWLNDRASGFTTPDGDEAVHAYWSTGKVGMTGTSHPGTLALAAATTGVEGLEVIIPIAPNTSPYHYYRSNGLIRHPFGYMGEDIDYLYDFVHSGNPERREYCDCNVRDKEMANGLDRMTGDYNDFWADRDYLNDLAPLKAAVLMAHAFNDWNVVPEHSNRIYQALKTRGVPVQVYYHQGGHGGQPPRKMMNRWFARYLHGVENGVEKGPRAWIVREDDDRNKPTPYRDYPNPAASPVTLYLTAGAPEQGRLGTTSRPEQGTETLVDNFSFGGATLAQAEWTHHRLMYVTPELTESVHLSGTPGMTIRLSCNKAAANLSVWLVSLPWTEGRKSKITDNIITRGWADPQNYRSLTESDPLVPGRFYDVTFNLQPDDQVIPAGQKIGLMILSSDRDFTLWPEPGTELTVDLDASSITLPVVGGAAAFARAIEQKSEKLDANDVEHPNVLFISVDDLNDWTGCLGGHPQALTPNIDRLAASGMLFTNAHCAAPACNPSRTAIMTGISPHKSGLYANGQKMREILPDAELLPKYFARNGYWSAGSGKILHYFIDAQSWDEYYPAKETEDPFPRTLYPEQRPVSLPRGGPWQYIETDWGPLDATDEEFGGDWLVSKWIGEQLRKKHSKPFFLACGIYRPHEPWFVPKKYFDLFPIEHIQLPTGYKESDLDDLPPAGQERGPNRYFAHIRAHKQWKQGIQGYLASIAFADAMVGRVIHALENGPNRDNTIVVLWSDHGWHLGEKQHWQKFTAWRVGTRIPLIVRVPVGAPGLPQGTRPGQTCAKPVNLLSLFPTLTELAGLPRKPDNDGPSIVPLLENSRADWPHVSITHLAEPGSYGLSAERWRYIHYANGDEELYDCQADPHEWTNLAATASHRAKLDELRSLAPQEFAPRVPPKDESMPKLKWHAATESPAPASKPDGGTFNVIFRNRREDAVNLYWMDSEGEPKSRGSIAAGGRIQRSTRPGAVWFIADPGNKPLGYFVVSDRSALAVIPEDT